jgi:pyruvate dehydrogenase (quinone)
MERRKFVQNLSLVFAGSTVVPNMVTAKPLSSLLPNNTKLSTVDARQSDTTADILVDKLIAWKVDVIFGIIGDGINPIIEALRKRKDQIRFITVRHEEAAAFMASAYAKYTGKLSACIATSGPGAVHLMNGIYDAAMEGAPVIAITGAVYHDLVGTSFTQEVDTVALMEKATVYNKMISGPRQALTIVDLACRAALTTPGVAHLTISKDTQLKPLSEDKTSKGSDNLQGSAAYTPRIEVPPTDELDAAAALLNAGSKIMILAGRGALNARDEVEKLAEKLGAPVAKALLGKALLPDESPYTTGGIGNLGTMPSKQMMQDCDTLLILGSNMPWLNYYPDADHAKAIQIDRDPKRIGLRYPVSIGLTGDVKATLQALLPKINHHNDRSFLKLAQGRMKDWRQLISQVEQEQAEPIKPQYLVAQVSKLLKDDALISIDTGSHTVFTARHLQIRPKQQVAVCGNLASMAPGLPYAIAAQIAYPGRQSVAMVGDGGFTMLMGEVATAVMYNLPIKVVIFKNGILSMDKYEQEELGNPDYGIDLQPIDFMKIAEACGAEGYHCSRSADVESTLKKAFASNRPAIIEVMVDPKEKPAKPEEVKV